MFWEHQETDRRAVVGLQPGKLEAPHCSFCANKHTFALRPGSAQSFLGTEEDHSGSFLCRFYPYPNCLTDKACSMPENLHRSLLELNIIFSTPSHVKEKQEDLIFSACFLGFVFLGDTDTQT